MLSFLNQFSKSRLSWALLTLTALAMELSALFFQHIMDLQPCVMCIYERIAMFGILFAGLIGMLNPQNAYIRWTGLTSWAISVIWGLKLGIEHVRYQFPDPNELFAATCDIFVTFPSWAPLNQWMPWMFEAYGDCSKIVWEFLTLTMPQWLVVIFAVKFLVLVMVVLSQFFGKTSDIKA